MVAKDFETGDLVWAKMKGYPVWPARIAVPPSNAPNKKAQHYVYFFGTGNYSWIADDKIKYHSDEMAENIPKKKYSGYQEGVTELIKESKIMKTSIKKSSEKNIEKSKPLNKSSKKSQDTVVTPPKKAVKTPSKKRPLTQDENAPTVKNTKKRRSTNELDDGQVKNAKDAPAEYKDLYEGFLPSIGISLNDEADLPKTKDTSPVSVTAQNKSDDEEEDEVQSFDKKIGFIGLGLMGQLMVQKLLTAKHTLYIWNRTLSKCDPFVKKGAIKASSPAEVVQECDITFCCVSDPHAVRTIIFGDNGVLKGFESCQIGSKGYVEMTSIDAETSNEIAEAIENAGMKYMEAPIIGSSKPECTNTVLLILASGDRQLFNDCEICFHAMCQHAYYLSCHIGRSANINIITSMFMGIVYAGLAEALALTERIKLSQLDLLEILELRGLNCDLIKSKGKAILQKDFTPVTYLKHQQKDMKLALSLSDTCDQPMPVANAANQVYNMARLLGCSDDDSAAVYHGSWL